MKFKTNSDELNRQLKIIQLNTVKLNQLQIKIKKEFKLF